MLGACGTNCPCARCRGQASLGITEEEQQEILQHLRRNEQTRKVAMVAGAVTIGATLLAFIGLRDILQDILGISRRKAACPVPRSKS